MKKLSLRSSLVGATTAVALVPLSSVAQHVPTEGADVILGILDNVGVYARNNGIAAISATTISCNKGNRVLEWKELPDNRHPIISLNLYRLADGRLQQIGQSWVKHGYFAVQGDACRFGCRPNPSGDGLGVGCSDPYGAGLNKGPGLGSRRDINPTTGVFDGSRINVDIPVQGSPQQDIRHGLQVREDLLGTPNARYFIEGQYIAGDDSRAGNGLNNVSFRELSMQRDGFGGLQFQNIGPDTSRETPVIMAWEGASFARLRSTEARVGGQDLHATIIVGSRAVALDGGRHRYEYMVYNMNSDRGIRSFRVPLPSGVSVTDPGFYAVPSHDDPWSNDPWTVAQEGGGISWQTRSVGENPNANAIRWGTAYNFWFTTNAPPSDIVATIGYFKPSDVKPANEMQTSSDCSPGTSCTVKGPGPAR
jgi:hypothetical protein